MTIKLADPCRAEPLKFTREENRIFAGVVAQKIIAERNCYRELHLSFFFAGTNNNMFRDEPITARVTLLVYFELLRRHTRVRWTRSTTPSARHQKKHAHRI